VRARGQRDLVVVTGHAAVISAGEFISATGTWVNDREHGLQFKAAHITTMQPTTVEGIEKYLGSGMIRGTGPTYAQALVRAFGEAVFDLIEQQPDRLREVTGIGEKRWSVSSGRFPEAAHEGTRRHKPEQPSENPSP
jgi:exodeoxyribonuclease V alpha subunit